MRRSLVQMHGESTLSVLLGRPGIMREPGGPRAIIESSQPLQVHLNAALEYLGHGQG